MKEIEFNTDWLFEDIKRNRKELVTLPHDAMINTDREEGGYTYFLLAGFKGGDYVYTKTIEYRNEGQLKRYILEFEAVYCMTTVEINGQLVKEKAYGFTPFSVELNPYLKEGNNEIRVVAHVPEDGHGRWYTGGGIYRPVHLYVGEAAYVLPQGIKVTTLGIDPARVMVEVQQLGGDYLEISLYERGCTNQIAQWKTDTCETLVSHAFELADAKLWDAENPNLYTVRVDVYKNGILMDSVEDIFGVRTVEVRPNEGLFVNNKRVFLKGGCIHNDMGVIGVINNDITELHRAKKIKKTGFNAIRSAHHPMSRSLMKACDEVGLYVMDEAFDHWYRMKNGNPYISHFMDDFIEDTKAMINDAYNHPSVIVYSIGNEIPEAGSVKGVRIGKQIVDTIHELDTTRLTTLCPSVHWLREYIEGTTYLTQDEDEWIAERPENKELDWNHYVKIFMGAINNLPDNEKGQVYPETYIKMDEDATKNLYPYLDIAGYNYYEDRYEILHDLHPERVILGTETRHTMLVDTMLFAKDHPYVIGDFLWTLQDHLGEANCCGLHYEEGEEYKQYPWLINYGGVIDLNGQILPAIHRYEFAWGEYDREPKHGLFLATQPPIHGGKAPITESYRWTDTIEGWTYEGYEGEPTFVDAYTDAALVEIFINGKSVGKSKVDNYYAKLPCIYEPGELMAVGYDLDGTELYRTMVYTAGKENVISATADKYTLQAGGQDFIFIDIMVTDDSGNIKLLPDYDIELKIEGPAVLQGFGSSYYKNTEKYNQNIHKTWQGRLKAVIRSTKETGKITVTLENAKCQKKVIEFESI